jgi:hypothetical protein
MMAITPSARPGRPADLVYTFPPVTCGGCVWAPVALCWVECGNYWLGRAGRADAYRYWVSCKTAGRARASRGRAVLPPTGWKPGNSLPHDRTTTVLTQLHGDRGRAVTIRATAPTAPPASTPSRFKNRAHRAQSPHTRAASKTPPDCLGKEQSCLRVETEADSSL